MRLTDWQLAFEEHLLSESAAANSGFAATLLGGPTLDVETGLAIYHNAYVARLQEVLRGDFGAVRYWLGDDEFALLSEAYVRRYPSAHYSLRWLGERFPGFILEHLIAEQSAPLEELARLEWAFTLAFDAAPGEPLTLQDMAQLPPEDWPDLRVELVPCVQQILCRFNTVAIWRSSKNEGDFPGSEPLAQAHICLTWRHQNLCQYRSLEAAEAWALSGMVSTGWSFSELCAELAVTYQEGAPLQAVTWLKQWIQDGLLQRRAP
ncbi:MULTISPECIES: DNA-binding domain-containing protein [unclassified Pseudomonas]|uniref:HvfC/BufC N-terminal domain-containing protein n=1 Tax=unclassified Pseudomonas TaxID=196821 RepID=UPI0015A02B09|nr:MULTISPECIES: DNA-binding domain-containing protein [unclassified Pseudomonas]NWC96227.1 putative DNA-binding domain-containing protein [Pseudomonas sp. IPO3779]NWD16743.1 putative DNA-binding domain-containing protein [Pseudomonas sp. IPO3778]